jgi:hypothetical protein
MYTFVMLIYLIVLEVIHVFSLLVVPQSYINECQCGLGELVESTG